MVHAEWLKQSAFPEQLKSVMRRIECVIEHVISHEAARRDRFCLVERPVDTEINSALPVFFFSLRQVGKSTRPIWAHISTIVTRHPVKFIRHERKSDVIGAVEPAQGLKKSTAKSAMTRWIRRKGRGEVWASQIAGRRA